MKTFRATKAGFTLVEIMIVVLIIGILLAIAIPNFVAAREAGRAKACVASLKQIDSAKQQAAMDNKLGGNDITTVFYTDGNATSPTATAAGKVQLVGSSAYLRSTPTCPSGGVYALGNVGTSPTCSITGVAGSGYAAGEKWYHGLPN